MELDLERYSFACCIACKQIELCEGLSPFAAFFLQPFSVMDPFDCKNMERKSWERIINFPHYSLFPELCWFHCIADFSFLCSPASPGKKRPPKVRAQVSVAAFHWYNSSLGIGKIRNCKAFQKEERLDLIATSVVSKLGLSWIVDSGKGALPGTRPSQSISVQEKDECPGPITYLSFCLSLLSTSSKKRGCTGGRTRTNGVEVVFRHGRQSLTAHLHLQDVALGRPYMHMLPQRWRQMNVFIYCSP